MTYYNYDSKTSNFFRRGEMTQAVFLRYTVRGDGSEGVLQRMQFKTMALCIQKDGNMWLF